MTDPVTTPPPTGQGLAERLAAVLAEHGNCNMVTSREGMTVWSCAVRTPKPDPESNVGYVDLNRAHKAVALASLVEAEVAAAEVRGEARAANAFVEWAHKNEIDEPPLDWAWFGEIARRYSPLHEQYEPRAARLAATTDGGGDRG